MDMVQITSIVLIVLAIVVAAIMWEIRDTLETFIDYQKEILSELVQARIRGGVVEGCREDDRSGPH
jgi:hypothetical protein